MKNPEDEIAEVFGIERDPLAEHSEAFRTSLSHIDPFEVYIENVVEPKNLEPRTQDSYERAFRQWKEFMDGTGRHPVCPNANHVKEWAHHRLYDVGNTSDTIKRRLRRLNGAYEYFQKKDYPHPTDYNPFDIAWEEIEWKESEEKDPPMLTTEELMEVIETIKYERDRAIIIFQLKFGLRAGEVANIKLEDVNIHDDHVKDHYDPEIGNHHRVRYKPNAVHIPPERSGNKSVNARVLPLDEETRYVLLQYLLTRPDNGEPWLFLSKTDREKIGNQAVNDIWKNAFHPEYKYDDNEDLRTITSHYGRHFFTSYWRIDQDINRQLVKYMRGDVVGQNGINGRESIDAYLHTNYDDIEEMYRDDIFRLGV